MSRTVLLFILAVLASSAHGAVEWNLPLLSAAPEKTYDAAQSITAPADSDVFWIDVRTEIHIDHEGRLTKTRSVVGRVLTQAGVNQVGHLIEPWAGWRQARPVVELRVITPDKKEHVLDPMTIVEAAVLGYEEIYSDLKILQIPLPALVVGSVVEYRITTADTRALVPGARFDRYEFALNQPTRHLLILIQAEGEIRAQALGFTANLDRRERTEGGLHSVEFEASDVSRQEAVPMLPPEQPAIPSIEFSTIESWRAVARWYADQTEPLLGHGPPAASESGAARLQRSAAILAELQKNVRYTGLELGLASYIPRPPAETRARGYGDCKEKSALLVSQLRAAGIEAKLALVRPYPASDVNVELPGLEAFNHAIVYVPGAEPLWIDPTAQYQPGGAPAGRR